MKKQEYDSDVWRPCKTKFSNGSECEYFFDTQCDGCALFRNGKCRTYSAIMRCYITGDGFPFGDLLERANHLAGKKCKRRKTELHRASRTIKQTDGQIELNL